MMKHEKVKWFVVVDRDMSFFQRLFAATVLRLGGIHWRTVDSKAAGMAILRRLDTSLPAD